MKQIMKIECTYRSESPGYRSPTCKATERIYILLDSLSMLIDIKNREIEAKVPLLTNEMIPFIVEEKKKKERVYINLTPGNIRESVLSYEKN